MRPIWTITRRDPPRSASSTASPVERADDQLPSRVSGALSGHYRLEQEIGAGGMATVYLAEDLRHSRRFALKVLRPELAAVIDAERFLAEIKLTANLQHPHIHPLFDSGEADGCGRKVRRCSRPCRPVRCGRLLAT
jgi:serine/threonine protein kinase